MRFILLYSKDKFKGSSSQIRKYSSIQLLIFFGWQLVRHQAQIFHLGIFATFFTFSVLFENKSSLNLSSNILAPHAPHTHHTPHFEDNVKFKSFLACTNGLSFSTLPKWQSIAVIQAAYCNGLYDKLGTGSTCENLTPTHT